MFGDDADVVLGLSLESALAQRQLKGVGPVIPAGTGPVVSLTAPLLAVTGDEQLWQGHPVDLVRVLGPAGQPATVRLVDLAEIVLERNPQARSRDLIVGWLERWQLEWCEKGAHATHQKPCDIHGA